MTTTSVLPQLGRYDLDIRRSTVSFTTRHIFGLAAVRGTFAIRTGTLAVAEPVEASRLRVEIDAGSFHTGTRARDEAVRSARFLDTGRYPAMAFTADGFTGDTLSGQLTVRDVTVPVTLTVGNVSVDSESFTASASARIDRFAFGVTASRGMAGRYLDLSVQACFARR